MDASLHLEEPASQPSVEKENSEVTEKILSLVMDILYLLIEEDYIVVKESGGHVKYSSATQKPAREASQRKNKKILEVTNKIIGLLVGEEWEYAQENVDLEKEVDIVDGRKQNPQQAVSSSGRRGSSRSFRPASIPIYIRKNGGIITVSPEDTSFKLMEDSSKPTVVTAAPSPSEDGKLPEIYIHIPTDQLDYSPSPDNCPSFVRETIPRREICKPVVSGREKLSQADYRAVKIKDEPEDWEERDLSVSEECDEADLSHGSERSQQLYKEKGIGTNNMLKQRTKIKQEPYDERVLSNSELEEQDSPASRTFASTDSILARVNSQVQYMTTLVKEEHEDELEYEEDVNIDVTDDSISPMHSFRRAHIEEVSYEYYSAHSSNVHPESDNPDKPFACSECGKCFKYNNLLMHHAKSHQKKPLICCDCGKQYSCKTEFEIHQRIHTGEKPFICTECGKGFRRKSHMLRHRRIHGEKQIFPCPECGKCFHRLDVLNQHRKIHRNNPPGSDMESLHSRSLEILSNNSLEEIEDYDENVGFACPECGKCFHHLDILTEHRKIHHNDSLSSDIEDPNDMDDGEGEASRGNDIEAQDPTEKVGFACSECGKCYDEMSQLERHQRVHSGEKPFSCTECGKSFRFEALLELHWGSHIATISCPECGKSFASQSLLNHHLKIHADSNDCICQECGKEFPSRSQLVDHYRTHTGEKPYMCPDCGKYFRRKAHVVRHRKIHTGNKPYSCMECGKCFESQDFLARHIKMHRRKRPHSCAQCGKSYTKKSHLVRHQRTHNRESPYTCSECGECFQYPALLRRHLKLHTGENSYDCSACDKSFGSEVALAQHQKMHSKEKSYICAECGKTFNFYSHFMRHQITHTGEKPYECPDCGKRFTRDSHLARHKRIHAEERALEI